MQIVYSGDELSLISNVFSQVSWPCSVKSVDRVQSSQLTVFSPPVSWMFIPSSGLEGDNSLIGDSTGLTPLFGRPSFKKNWIMWEFFFKKGANKWKILVKSGWNSQGRGGGGGVILTKSCVCFNDSLPFFPFPPLLQVPAWLTGKLGLKIEIWFNNYRNWDPVQLTRSLRSGKTHQIFLRALTIASLNLTMASWFTIIPSIKGSP